MKLSVLSLNTKKQQHWCPYFQITRKYWNYFMTNQLNIIFGGFGIWLLGYRI